MSEFKQWAWLIIPIGITVVAVVWGIGNAQPATTLAPTATPAAAQVLSSCATSITYPAIDPSRLQRPLTFNVYMQDQRPVAGLCIAAILDNAPFETLQFIGTCVTGKQGQCTMQVPAGVMRLQFGDTTIDGLSLADSINDISSLVNPAPDAIVYYIDANTIPEISYLIAVPRNTSNEIVLKTARRDEQGLFILQPDVPDWTTTTRPTITPVQIAP